MLTRLFNIFKKKSIPWRSFFDNRDFESDDEISSMTLDKFLAVHGEKGVKTLSIFVKYKPLKDAMKSTIGKEILNDVVVNMELLIHKIIDLSASPKELSEYRVLRLLLLRWARKISMYEEAKKKLMEV